MSTEQTNSQIDWSDISEVQKTVSRVQSEELQEIRMITVDEVVKSLSEFEFDHAKIDLASPIILDPTIELKWFHAEKDLHLEYVPNSLNGENIVEIWHILQ